MPPLPQSHVAVLILPRTAWRTAGTLPRRLSTRLRRPAGASLLLFAASLLSLASGQVVNTQGAPSQAAPAASKRGPARPLASARCRPAALRARKAVQGPLPAHLAPSSRLGRCSARHSASSPPASAQRRPRRGAAPRPASPPALSYPPAKPPAAPPSHLSSPRPAPASPQAASASCPRTAAPASSRTPASAAPGITPLIAVRRPSLPHILSPTNPQLFPPANSSSTTPLLTPPAPTHPPAHPGANSVVFPASSNSACSGFWSAVNVSTIAAGPKGITANYLAYDLGTSPPVTRPATGIVGGAVTARRAAPAVCCVLRSVCETVCEFAAAPLRLR